MDFVRAVRLQKSGVHGEITDPIKGSGEDTCRCIIAQAAGGSVYFAF